MSKEANTFKDLQRDGRLTINHVKKKTCSDFEGNDNDGEQIVEHKSQRIIKLSYCKLLNFTKNDCKSREPRETYGEVLHVLKTIEIEETVEQIRATFLAGTLRCGGTRRCTTR